MKVQFHSFFNGASGEAEWSHLCADRVTSWKTPAHTYGIKGWVSHSAGLGAFQKIKISCAYRESKSEIPVARPVAYNSIETKCINKSCGFPLTTDRIHHLNASMECDIISVYWAENGQRTSIHNLMISVDVFCNYDLMQYFYCEKIYKI